MTKYYKFDTFFVLLMNVNTQLEDKYNHLQKKVIQQYQYHKKNNQPMP